jgi:gliding motility-associated-like protein
MRKLLLAFFLCIHFTGISQTGSFSFSCTKDTLVSCTIPCITLKARIPDLHGLGNTYDVNPISGAPGGCYSPYTPPDVPGTVTPFVQDDFYSDVIPIGFNFPFYGTVYNSLVASTNGYISFDISNANLPCHYSLAPGNVPNGTYDRALIMGPYHDIDPEVAVTYSPNMVIGYSSINTAPYRKWIFSFYKVPLYSTNPATCGPLIENTHQIVLYESTGIIEVFVKDKQICNAWNGGKAMIGLQDFTKSQGMVAPGRGATDPPWGNKGMNESWRFVPSAGPSLFKRVELLDMSGNIITTGSTTSLGNSVLEASFPNICPTTSPAYYVVRSVYQKIDDPTVEIFGTDTVTVTRDATLPVTTTKTEPLCFGGYGSITVTDPLGPVYEYSINGTSWQTSPVFTVPAGTYTVRTRITGTFCSGNTTVTINEPPLLSLSAVASTASCSNNDGVVTLTASGGTTPYQYSIDNGATFQSNNVFSSLPVAAYNNIKVKDANGCMANTNATISLDDQMFLSLGNDTTICVGSSITLQPQTNTQTDTFKWTPAVGLSSDKIKNPVASPADTTHYFLTAKWGICSRNDDIWIKILHKPVVYAGKDTSICYKTFAWLNGVVTNFSGPLYFAWTPATNVTPASFPQALAKPDTTQNYTLTVTDNYGCNFSVSDDILVTMRPPVPANAGNDTNAVYGIPHQLFGSGGKNYYWSPSTPLNNPFAQNPLATLYNDTRFTLLVTDDIGCSNSDDVFVKVYQGPTYYLPNAFSPNGDGLNDIFKPIPVGISVTQYFSIYNRNGEQVFETNQWLQGWDGTIKGKKASAGAYVWIIKGIDRNGKVVEMKGTVLLIR